MFIRWNNSSKIWTTGMGQSLKPADTAGLDKNFRTTLLVPATGDLPSNTVDILVMIIGTVPMFLYATDLSEVDMRLVERSSIAHPLRLPVLCRPAFNRTYHKLSREQFLKTVNKYIGVNLTQILTPAEPFTRAELDSRWSGYLALKTVSYNDLKWLVDHCIVFITDSEGDKGKRYLYLETNHYDYLIRPQDEVVWVRDHTDNDNKQPWNNWSSDVWVAVSEDTDELHDVLENHFQF